MKFGFFVLILFLSGCASHQSTDALEMAKSVIAQHEAVKFTADVDMASSPMEGGEREKETANIWQLSAPACAKPFLDALGGMAPPPLVNGGFVENLKQQASRLEAQFHECIARYNLRGSVLAVVAGKQMTIPEYLDSFMSATLTLAAAQAATDSERDYSIKFFGTALASGLSRAASYPVNPSISTVSPYMRRDGSFVMPHLRTTPNDTCLDNLGGCR